MWTSAPDGPGGPSVGALAGHVGRELLRAARDRLARGGAIPRRIEDVDARVLGRLLGRPVESVAPLDRTEGTTDRVRLGVRGAGLPASVFVKMAPRSPLHRFFGNLARLGASEIGFYRDLRPQLALEAPAALGWDRDEATGRFALVLEDLQARGARFADVLTPCEPARAKAVLGTLAALHGACWGRPDDPRSGLAWLGSNASDPLIPLVARAVRRFGRRLAASDPGLVPEAGRPILARYAAVARELDAGSHTVLHGDPHPGNCYFVDGRAGLLDWQVVRRGNPLRDATYFLVLALAPDTRRAHERELLAGYAAALAAAGGPSPAPAELWATYRKMAAYPYVAATFTTGLAGLQEDAVAREGLRRAALAIQDLASARALDALA